eukprot:TRINITY_DN2847_c0_g1_i1.p1 TRINITY_DN2847_c0_g1~~TRINITY_DN2847_c0_g1_i1.p1  ORF type:complete len:193 (+),score=38.50 TRINITY_DN2847_c0_g1_i1:519-1097(+)
MPAAESNQLYKFVRSLDSAELVTSSFKNVRHFGNFSLCLGAQRMLTTPNAGGTSDVSEALSFECFNRAFGARLLKTEMEIDYRFRGGKITDYLMRMHGVNLGVSVTRAMKFQGTFQHSDAVHLLQKKLQGVNASTWNVSSADAWHKQLLHVWCTSDEVASITGAAWQTMPAELRANTVVVLTVAATSPWIFF